MTESASRVEARTQKERVTLAPLELQHLPDVRRWRSDPEVTRHWITQHVPELDEVEVWLRQNQSSGSITLVILDESDAPIGYADVFNLDRENRKCEIALMIGERSRWGQGYGREALNILLGQLFTFHIAGGVQMHKVTLEVFAENEAARRVYRACGFNEDGVLRDDMYREGRWHDQILMSILEDEFRELQAESGQNQSET